MSSATTSVPVALGKLEKLEAELREVGLKVAKTESAIEDLEKRIDNTTDVTEKERLYKRFERLSQKEAANELCRVLLLQEKSQLSLLTSTYTTPPSTPSPAVSLLSDHIPSSSSSSSGLVAGALPATVSTASIIPHNDDKDSEPIASVNDDKDSAPIASVNVVPDWKCNEKRDAHDFCE
ncbi:hypothetical protein HK104_003168, partial [Borealophlyctis nickersoniae]